MVAEQTTVGAMIVIVVATTTLVVVEATTQGNGGRRHRWRSMERDPRLVVAADHVRGGGGEGGRR